MANKKTKNDNFYFKNYAKPAKRSFSCYQGQSLVEYILVVAFVAIAAIASLQFLSQNIRYKLTQISSSLGAKTPGVSAPKAPQGLTEKKDINTVFSP